MHVFDPQCSISEVPSEVRWSQVTGITAIALILTVLATIYPAFAAPPPSRLMRCGTSERPANQFELLIGWRHLRANRGNRFISFIATISMGGVAIGVAVLI